MPIPVSHVCRGFSFPIKDAQTDSLTLSSVLPERGVARGIINMLTKMTTHLPRLITILEVADCFSILRSIQREQKPWKFISNLLASGRYGKLAVISYCQVYVFALLLFKSAAVLDFMT